MTETEITQRIYDFVHEIGLKIEERTLPEDTFLPGLELGSECIFVDPQQLKYPGDILHEAGHLAVTTPDQRKAIGTANLEEPFPTDGEEIASVLWSYAALKYIGLPVEVVFHPNGYKGQSQWLIESLTSGNYIGLPLLEWMGLTFTPEKAAELGKNAFPQMERWLRNN